MFRIKGLKFVNWLIVEKMDHFVTAHSAPWLHSISDYQNQEHFYKDYPEQNPDNWPTNDDLPFKIDRRPTFEELGLALSPSPTPEKKPTRPTMETIAEQLEEPGKPCEKPEQPEEPEKSREKPEQPKRQKPKREKKKVDKAVQTKKPKKLRLTEIMNTDNCIVLKIVCSCERL